MTMPKKILVLDDSPAIRLLYEDELSEEGYEVMTCDDGSGLMETIRKKRPDLKRRPFCLISGPSSVLVVATRP